MKKLLILPLVLLGFFNGVNASDVIENSYIIVLKEQVTDNNDLYAASTYGNVRETAEYLINEVKLNQSLIQNRRGLTSSASAVTNSLGFVYEHSITGFSATLTAEGIEYLQNNALVDFIEPDMIVTGNAIQSPVGSWGLDRIDQTEVDLNDSYEYRRDGTGVHAYIIDSGIRGTHNEFAGRIGKGFKLQEFIFGDRAFYRRMEDEGNPSDCNGHGTHVAGTLGGITHGVAKNVTVHSVKVLGLDCSSRGSISHVVAGIDWVVKHAISPAVANISISSPISEAFDKAINRLIAANITVVAAAGNDHLSDACTISPARVPNAITVAATQSNDSRTWFTNIGNCVDIFAPGRYILSAGIDADDSEKRSTGTSMASPHVAGVAALFLEANPDATPAQVTTAILDAATVGVVKGDIGIGSPNRLLFSIIAEPSPGPSPGPSPSTDLAWLIPVINLILF